MSQPKPFNDEQIITSWDRNAAPWTASVREGRIESRRLVTDEAIVGTVLDRSPGSVLDIGCGEGWLARILAAKGIRVIGTDVVPSLIEEAERAGDGDFRLMSYEDIADGKLEAKVDVAVCNFSLIGEESVQGLFKAIPSLLNHHGAFVVQTLHPHIACGDLPYRDGWREGSWNGFRGDFTDPAPWYFRTLKTWRGLYKDNGFRLREIREPIHPKTKRPASIIFIGDIPA
jgi:2-polyprenyl-3-methyl-5-hydroxy-6-metoxy-1,4-benzoquinol methylase